MLCGVWVLSSVHTVLFYTNTRQLATSQFYFILFYMHDRFLIINGRERDIFIVIGV